MSGLQLEAAVAATFMKGMGEQIPLDEELSLVVFRVLEMTSKPLEPHHLEVMKAAMPEQVVAKYIEERKKAPAAARAWLVRYLMSDQFAPNEAKANLMIDKMLADEWDEAEGIASAYCQCDKCQARRDAAAANGPSQ